MESWVITITYRSSGRCQFISEFAPTKNLAIKQVKARFSRRWIIS